MKKLLIIAAVLITSGCSSWPRVTPISQRDLAAIQAQALEADRAAAGIVWSPTPTPTPNH